LNSFEKALQQIVLTVNRWPLGMRLTKLPYRAAVVLFRRQLRRDPLILAAYARNSYANGTWIPGRSDIDLTVILREGGAPQEEYACVRKLRKNYASLQRWFPMLGELEIINEAHLEAWTRFTIAGYESRHWLRLYGKEVVPIAYKGDAEQRQRDRLNHAINIYRYLMIPALGTASQQILVRYVKKILRYLDESADAAADEGLAEKRPERLQATVVHGLEKAVISQATMPVGGKVLDLDVVLGKAVTPSVRHGAPSPFPSDQLPAKELLDGVLRSANDPEMIYFVPRPGLDLDHLEACIAAINPGAYLPVVMPGAVLMRYLECVDPLEHLALLQDRTVLWGNDPLQFPKALLDTTFTNAVCAYSTHILLEPYKSDLNLMSPGEARDLLFGWILRTARYLEDNVMDFDYDRLCEYWRRVHPEDKVEIQADNLNDGLQRFVLFRRVADDICAGMLSASDNGKPAIKPSSS